MASRSPWPGGDAGPQDNPEGAPEAQAQSPWPGGAVPSSIPPVRRPPREPASQGPDGKVHFIGRRGRLFWLALKTAVLTVLTLGFYRFWMKTRLRRYYWSSIRPANTPLEYTGEPLEKLLGFLIAVVFLAFYIGVVNLILMYASFALFHGNATGYAVSFVGVIPIIFFAMYRARRYILARTRWRGMRFGLEPGAWGYAWRALMHWAITILTMGLLTPRMTFWLEKYRTDRTHFGDVTMHQGGSWRMLWPKLRHLIIGVGLCAIATAGAAAEIYGALWLLLPGLPWALFGFVFYRVESFRILAEHKTLGGTGFRSRPRPWRVFRIYLFGNMIIYSALVLVVFAISFVFVAMLDLSGGNFEILFELERLSETIPTWVQIAGGMLIYFTFFILWGVFSHVFLTLPLLQHYTETLEFTDPAAIDAITQRARDDFAQAEGFAEALDVGAAI